MPLSSIDGSITIDDANPRLIDGLHASPIRRLAPEILSIIFLHCVLDDFPRASVRHAPLILGRICGAWRQVALCTPQLWSSLCIGNIPGHEPWKKWGGDVMEDKKDDEDDDEAEAPVKRRRDPLRDAIILEEWVARSGSYPLYLLLDYSGTPEPAEIPEILELIQTTLLHSRRWRYFSIHVPFLRCAADVLSSALLPGQSPTLESLFVTCDHGAIQLTVDLRAAHQLRSLTVQNRQPGSMKLRFGDHALQNIVTLRLSLNTIDQCLSYLPHFPSLEEFAIEFIDYELTQSDREVCNLHRLHTLQLGSYYDPGLLLDGLHLPALRTLKIETIEKMRSTLTSPWPHLASLLARSEPPLEMLKITGISISPSDFSRCLQRAPNLKILLLYDVVIGDEDLHALILPPSQFGQADEFMRPCPRLEELHLKNCYRLPLRALSAVILSRWHCSCTATPERNSDRKALGCGSLHQVVVDQPFDLRGQLEVEVQRCINEGLVFTYLNNVCTLYFPRQPSFVVI